MKDILVGKKITGIKLSADKESIMFIVDEGFIVADCDADCCSSTWIEHIELPALGLPALVLSVVDIDLKEPEFDSDGEYIQYYGLKIETDKGVAIIDYRNSSNGYYGGSIEFDNKLHCLSDANDFYSTEWVDISSDI